MARYTSPCAWLAASACWMPAAAPATDPRNWPMWPRASRASISRRSHGIRARPLRAAQSRVRTGVVHRSCLTPTAPSTWWWRSKSSSTWKTGADFLQEVRRVLAPAGQLIVSTPNRLYYTESRGTQGANPFHVHEFDFEEFTRELQAVFPARFDVPGKPRRGRHVPAARAGPHGGSARGCRRARARREPLLRRRLRAPPADRQPDVSLRAARGQRAARTRAPYRQARRRTRHQGSNGSTRRRRIWPSSTASTRSCWSCSASRRKNWSAAIVGRRS